MNHRGNPKIFNGQLITNSIIVNISIIFFITFKIQIVIFDTDLGRLYITILSRMSSRSS